MERTDYSPARGPWAAPHADGPLDAAVRVPGSKSLMNRELVLSALAVAPSIIRRPLVARDTTLMAHALLALGASIEDGPEHEALIEPASMPEGDVEIDCGLAGTVMRFIPPVAALATGRISFDGDPAAQRRPMGPILAALERLGLGVRAIRGAHLPFSIEAHGAVRGGELEIDASASSQFVSGLLLAAPRYAEGLTLRHTGERLPSVPHIDMTIESLRVRGVDAQRVDERTWRVEPGPIAGRDLLLQPDLSNAEPFLIAAIVAGGAVRVEDWPKATTQVGSQLVELLPRFGAELSITAEGSLQCDGGEGILGGRSIPGLELDLAECGELAPNLAALCALADSPSRLTGIGHLRGHETDRIAALATELRKLGAVVEELEDGLAIAPAATLAEGVAWASYEDHRMATSGAIVGLLAPGLVVDDVGCTSKTMPEFAAIWHEMLDVSRPGEPANEAARLGEHEDDLPAAVAVAREGRG